jgi:hypothetical protein
MYKKIIILPCLFILSNLLYIGCCKCVESKNFYYAINNISASVRGSGQTVIDTGLVTNVDSVFLRYQFDIDCVSSRKNPFSFLVNQTYACKCNECGLSGLKVPISTLEITSDSLYNGIPANNPLNGFFKAVSYDYHLISLDSLKVLLASDRSYGATFVSTVKPGNNLGHKFKLKMLFTDGRELTASTKTIYWQ